MMLEIPEERGEEERRGARTPCTVTAPARIAGHRLPVWANKIGRVLPLLCELNRTVRMSKWEVVCVYTAGTVAQVCGAGQDGRGLLDGLREQEELVCGIVDGGRTRSLEQGFWRAVCGAAR